MFDAEDSAGKPTRLVGRAKLLQSILTSAAILIAGTYALYQAWVHRDTALVVTVDQTIQSWVVTPDYRWIHLAVKVHNDGKVFVEIPTARVLINQVMPLDGPIGVALKARNSPFMPKDRLARWPKLCDVEHIKINFALEPMESDLFVFDAFVPSTVRVINIFTHLKSTVGNGWQTTSVVEFKEEAGDARLGPTGNLDDIRALCPGIE